MTCEGVELTLIRAFADTALSLHFAFSGYSSRSKRDQRSSQSVLIRYLAELMGTWPEISCEVQHLDIHVPFRPDPRPKPAPSKLVGFCIVASKPEGFMTRKRHFCGTRTSPTALILNINTITEVTTSMSCPC